MHSNNANRILVVKVGTSTLTDTHGRLDRSFLIDFTSQLAACQNQGWHVILVTSGAIRAGKEVLERRNRTGSHRQMSDCADDNCEQASDEITALPFKQAAAAIGQGRLMSTYTEAFAWRNIDCAQVLLTKDDLLDTRRVENARNTLMTLLTLGVIPIINENDTVAVDEIRFGDNDNLAALVATLIRADLLLILSDVEGLYDAASAREIHSEDAGQPIAVVERVDEAVHALADGTGSEFGTGGMRTKVEAAKTATEAGIRTVIARGRRPGVVASVVEFEEVGTTFLPQAGHWPLSTGERDCGSGNAHG